MFLQSGGKFTLPVVVPASVSVVFCSNGVSLSLDLAGISG